ncbi:MAG: alpha-L-fucosidase [Anaerolineae bacterium]|nr:alpha-L-fucosidase [Anaerolineae bacterium]MDW8099208.1 alpha-L-fucosidase [Anaerolineae bacterium]
MPYKPTWESVRAHPVPDWFHNAKLGIFIHWGLYSVPAWAPLAGELSEVLAGGDWERWFTNNPYAEWYMNSIRIPGSPSHQHHVTTYGPEFEYADFAPMFQQAVEKWDPNAWADLFRRVGARYVVLTTKHHDGFLLWPSRQPNPFREGYFSRRDLVGELTAAVRASGMRMGLYYSGGLDWTFNPTVIRRLADIPIAVPQSAEYVAYANGHWRELIERYEPSILWNDIAYPAAADLPALFADYYNRIPDGLVNDRFTQRFELGPEGFALPDHYDFRTPEYTSFREITPFKWEATRGIGASFGYNQNEGPAQYLSVEALVHLLVDIVSKNGNLLLNVGPMADGTIPDLQKERLLGLGQWLDVNGEAIFDTRPWVKAEATTPDGVPVRFTQKGDVLYAILLGTPQDRQVVIPGLQAQANTGITLLGNDSPLAWRQEDEGLAITLSAGWPTSPAHALKITPLPHR